MRPFRFDERKESPISVCHVFLSDTKYGLANVVTDLSNEMAATNRVAVAANRDILWSLDLDDSVERLELAIELGPIWRNHYALFPRYVTAARTLTKVLRVKDYSVVNFHLPGGLPIALFFNGHQRIVHTLHGVLFRQDLFGAARGPILRRALRNAKLITVVNDSARQELPPWSLPPDTQLRLIRNGIDKDRILRMSRLTNSDTGTMRARGDEKVVVFPGRIELGKGQERFVRALSHLPVDSIKLVCYMVGSGPDEGRVRSLVKEFGLQDVVLFTGFLDNPFPLMNAADWVVTHIGAEYPGVSQVHLEGLALRKRIISLIDDERSVALQNLIFPVTTIEPTRLAEELAEIFSANRPLDAKRCDETIAGFTTRIAAKNYLDAYSTITE